VGGGEVLFDKLAFLVAQEGGKKMRELIQYLSKRAGSIAWHSDRLTRALENFSSTFGEEIAKVAGEKFTDSEKFSEWDLDYVQDPEFLFLSVRKKNGRWGIYAISEDASGVAVYELSDLPRHCRVDAVRRLPQFLEAYKNKLQDIGEELESVSQKIEKAVEALKAEA